MLQDNHQVTPDDIKQNDASALFLWPTGTIQINKKQVFLRELRLEMIFASIQSVFIGIRMILLLISES